MLSKAIHRVVLLGVCLVSIVAGFFVADLVYSYFSILFVFQRGIPPSVINTNNWLYWLTSIGVGTGFLGVGSYLWLKKRRSFEPGGSLKTSIIWMALVCVLMAVGVPVVWGALLQIVLACVTGHVK